MEQPTPEQVAVARERLETWPRAATLHGDVATILAHLDAVEAERDANRHELDQLVQETLLPLQRELAEAREGFEGLSTLLAWNREAMEAFGVTGGPDITDAIQWAQRQKQELAEARAAIKQVDGNVTAWREGTRRAWLDLPAVKKAMEEG